MVFNVGGLELVAIALVALVVLGPDRLPAALRQAGSVLGQLRRMSDGFRIDVRAALAEDAVDRSGAEPRVD
ncbi:MAG TPA: twin-arginine translocase subunit TatB [Acidimicrobiaceae bacterium]|nr:twin-arginine translocase subunit TatB [Acidimicrobiaceae bacterium]